MMSCPRKKQSKKTNKKTMSRATLATLIEKGVTLELVRFYSPGDTNNQDPIIGYCNNSRPGPKALTCKK